MYQPNDSIHSGESDRSKEKQPIPMTARFSKAILVAAVMMVIGWAIGTV